MTPPEKHRGRTLEKIRKSQYSPPYFKGGYFHGILQEGGTITAEKTKSQRITAEKARLRKIFAGLPPEAAGTVAGLIDQAAFMRVECEEMEKDLQENGWTEKFQQSTAVEPYDRARPIGQTYNSVNGNYQKIIKQLTALLPKPEAAAKAEGDGFDKFITGRDEL